jgi:anti-sigma regulatory factor (Ser/Thr protein kinase)
VKELSLNILDIVQNSIRAKANLIEILINESENEDFIKIQISDNGNGIPKEMLKVVTDPYTTSRTTRKVGLGLAFLKQHAEMSDGGVEVESIEGMGTKISASFSLHHVDRQPMGDIAGVIKILIMANPDIDFVYFHKSDNGEFCIDTREIKVLFEVNNLTDNNLMQDVKEMITQNLSCIGAVK